MKSNWQENMINLLLKETVTKTEEKKRLPSLSIRTAVCPRGQRTPAGGGV